MFFFNKVLSLFFIDFGSLLEPFLRSCSVTFRSRDLTFSKKSTLRPIRKNQWYLINSGLPGRPWGDQIETKIVFFFLMIFGLKIWSFLDHFWITFGPLWEPKGAQNRTKIGLRFGMGSQRVKMDHFGTILGPFWGLFGPFWYLFGAFWDPFGYLFDWIWIDVRYNLNRILFYLFS